MEHQNVCKFNISRASDLICTNFIFETAGKQARGLTAEHHLLGLVTGGAGKLCFQDRVHSLGPGMLFVVQRSRQFRIVPEDNLQYFYISFYGRRAEEYMTRLGIGEDRCVFPDRESLIPFWQNSQLLAEEGNIDMLCEAVLLYSLAGLRPEKAGNHDLLTRIIRLTQEHFSNSDLSVSTIAAELGYDPKYLSSFFIKKRGIPFTSYLRELRIRHAVFLMEEGLVSVKNIAQLSGFRDPLYFSKVFTQTEGITPKAYIERIGRK